MSGPFVEGIDEGQRTLDVGGSHWGPLACQFHSGSAVIDQAPRVDPDTGKDRVVDVYDPDTGETSTQVVLFPEYSDDVGFQPECFDCQFSVVETKLHIQAVQADRAQADMEFQRELRRRGMVA